MNVTTSKKIMALCLTTIMCSCAHKTTTQLVGNDRDEHGCIASAGYRWSEAKKDCVRLWEVGVRADCGDDNVYVVFSDDREVAEVFTDKDMVLCRRDGDVWKAKKKHIEVVLDGDIVKVSVKNKMFVQTKK